MKRIIAVLALATVGCVGGDGTGVEGEQGEIINGNPVGVDTFGTPLLGNPAGHCTSTVLSDRWVLTARHCATVEGTPTGVTPWQPSQISVAILNGPSAPVAQVYLHPSADVALLQLGSSLLNPSGVTYANPLWLGPGSSLTSYSLYCQGWGKNTFDTGGLVLRSAGLNVSSAGSSTFRLIPNSAGQIQWEGDSGSSCFISVDGAMRAVGVVSVCGYDKISHVVQFCDAVSNDAFRAWAQGIMGNAATMFRDGNFGGGSAQALSPGGPNSGLYNTSQLTVGNDAISSLMLPLGWFVTLYGDANFANPMATYTATTPLVASNVNDKTSSIAVSMGGVYLRRAGIPLANFTHAGGYTLIQPSVDNLTNMLMVPAGWRVTLYDNADLTGASATFNEGTYLTLGSFNNLASGLLIEEPVAVYVDSNYNGAYAQLLPGCYDLPQMGVPNDSISSIFVPANMTVTAYPNSVFGGTPATYITSQASLGNFNDAISSICVSRNR